MQEIFNWIFVLSCSALANVVLMQRLGWIKRHDSNPDLTQALSRSSAVMSLLERRLSDVQSDLQASNDALPELARWIQEVKNELESIQEQQSELSQLSQLSAAQGEMLSALCSVAAGEKGSENKAEAAWALKDALSKYQQSRDQKG